MSDTRLIGHCAVDSGQIMLVDPCYVIGDAYTEKHYGNTIDVTCGDKRSCGPDLGGLAVSTETGVGDGRFPVYGTFDGPRIVSVEIKFSEDTDEDDSYVEWDSEEEDD